MDERASRSLSISSVVNQRLRLDGSLNQTKMETISCVLRFLNIEFKKARVL